MAMKPLAGQRLQSPMDQVALELSARRARRLVRLQIGAIVVISMTAGLLGGLSAALPD